jgi:hypothetical protein
MEFIINPIVIKRDAKVGKACLFLDGSGEVDVEMGI